jgi:hypothetical protein
MSEPDKTQRPPDETTVLHLNKFAPDKPEAPLDSHPGIDDTATIFIKRAAAETVNQSAQPVAAPKADNALAPKDMLGALTYCYAKGVFTSEEIERKLRRDTELRVATRGDLPDANAIRRFRKFNRDAIQATLEKWYRKLRKQQAAAAALQPHAPPPEPSPLPSGSSAPAEDQTTMISRHEASERLNKAAFIDNMSKDG